MTNLLIDTQLAHNEWAIRKLIDACRGLTSEQFHRAHDIGPPPGSLQALIAHLIAGMFYFADNFDGRTYVERPCFGAKATTVEGLTGLLEQADRELSESIHRFLDDRDLSSVLVWQFGDVPVTAAVALAHVFNHGTHHRAQCVYVFKCLGARWPELWPLEWAAEPRVLRE